MNPYRYIDDVKVARELGLADERTRSVHLHTLNGKPLIGSTTAKGIIAKGDGLMQWYADMAAVVALGFPAQDIKAEYDAVQKIQDKKERSAAKRALDTKYPDFAVARRAAVTARDEAADAGSERHDELELYIKACLQMTQGIPLPVPPGASPSLTSFVYWAGKNVDKFYFTEAHCYHEGIWVGGIADVGMLMKDGKRLVGDHKSSKEAYSDQFLQCALYDILLNHSGGMDKDGNKQFDWPLADGYVVFPFRSDPFTPEFRFDAGEWRSAAKEMVHLYKLLELN